MLRRIILPPWLLVTIVVSFLVRIPSFFEPFYYGDEMIYLALGQGIRRGLILYKDIHDNKPPLLYFLAAISGNVFWFRALLCGWMIVTIIVFWHFTKLLFKTEKQSILATILFSFLTALPLIEGEVSNAELFMLLPTIAACMLVWKNHSSKNAFTAGLLLSIAALFKIPSIFDAGAVIVIWLFSVRYSRKEIFLFIRNSVILFFGIALPIALSFVWYSLRGAIHEYTVAAFLQNFGYVNSWRGEASQQVPFLVKNGPLVVRAVLAAAGFLLLYILSFSKRRSHVFLFTCAWAITSLFAVTLSERPYPHYLVQLIPSITILFSFLFSDETIEHVLVVFPLTAIFAVCVYFNFWQYSTSLYFGRFQTLLTGDNRAYLTSFSPQVERNYKIAQVVRETTSPTDQIFVVGDSAGIYALSNRLPPIKYVADYHIRDFSSDSEVVQALERTKPKLVVILPEAQNKNAFLSFVQKNYLLLNTVSEAKFWYNTNR